GGSDSPAQAASQRHPPDASRQPSGGTPAEESRQVSERSAGCDAYGRAPPSRANTVQCAICVSTGPLAGDLRAQLAERTSMKHARLDLLKAGCEIQFSGGSCVHPATLRPSPAGSGIQVMLASVR